MNEMSREQMKMIFEIKKKIHHLQLSQTLPISLFSLLKTVETCSQLIKIADQEIAAMKVNDLFNMIHVTRPAISKALKECESRGYVSRFTSEKDKRFSYVSLKEEGNKAIQAAEKEINESLNWISEQFDEKEKEQFRHLIVRFNQILSDFEKKGR